MYKLCVLALAGACSAAHAQTPAINPMPDGSRDMYVGLGAQYAPRYEGAADRRTTAMPMLQVQWSNGIFISGMSMGMHLSSSPSVEFGPLLALAPGRDASGTKMFRLGTVGDNAGNPGGPSTWLPPPIVGLPPPTTEFPPTDDLPPTETGDAVKGDEAAQGGDGITPDNTVNLLDGVHTIKRRVLYGGFANFYLTPQLRLTTNALYGAGNDRNGLRVHVALQHLQQDIAPHHTVALSAGVTLVNRAYNMAYFGVTREEADNFGFHAEYHPDGGIEDVRAGARWNWALAPAWMVTTGLQVSRLVGDARKSPLVERPTNVSVSTALVYRF
ncbi:MipA/OmpV family protein [Pseudoduganella umbonata]|uniref:MipA/OmpV family protein n=1 Tax=Pseudoduganella umbonata TaxID=864828 RepID=A0A4P8HRK0_9BURK|nr:MipA/OmpV family protein [Pseudoduganella umbonata]MBB3222226.1 outer membrane scaffolding protein for murein synthesis (MipA/OmpV family) [Pseudoduganella umbonata]QCP12457.1 MipA/OmpV family protein [Pseudoduganella umbonata]